MLGVVNLPPALVERLLDRWPVARLATLGRDGPHQVPVVFARTGTLAASQDGSIEIKKAPPKPIKALPPPKQDVFDFMRDDKGYKLPPFGILESPRKGVSRRAGEKLRLALLARVNSLSVLSTA